MYDNAHGHRDIQKLVVVLLLLLFNKIVSLRTSTVTSMRMSSEGGGRGRGNGEGEGGRQAVALRMKFLEFRIPGLANDQDYSSC